MHLAERIKIDLEQVIVDASHETIAPTLPGAVEIICGINGRSRYKDRGEALHCNGLITFDDFHGPFGARFGHEPPPSLINRHRREPEPA